jgi:3-hydroxyacyl-CoA dehydrogenase
MNPDRLLAEAKARALAMVDEYTPPEPTVFHLPGPGAKALYSMGIDDFYAKGDATYVDVMVADALLDIVTGGNTYAGQALTESDIAQLEREHFLSLLKTKQTQARIAHTLKTGKPLREDPLATNPSLDEIRATRRVTALPRKVLTGHPLKGPEALKLRLMAEMTATLLKQVAR